MFILVLIGAVLAIAAGLTVKVILDKTNLRDAGTITMTELVVGSFVCALVLMPAVAGIGIGVARADAVTFNEYWSGMEKSYDMDTITCSKDGPCSHEYDCDSYWVTEHYTEQEPYSTTESYTKSDGTSGTRSVTKYKTVHKTRQVQKWHSCPFVTHEYTFTVRDTLGETHNMGNHLFPENPRSHRWTGSGHNDDRWGSGNNLPNVKTGQPSLWVKAKARIDAGTPGGVTSVHTYKNYILASQEDIYAKSSNAIATYKKAGLLPKPVTGTHDYYLADKAYFVGPVPGSAADWQETVMRFNGTFGSQEQGDLHLIVVTDPKITNPDEYTNALLAYWQSTELDKNALSKNGYVVVVGSTDGSTVTWARGFSGMPIGNERLSVDVREDLTGTALTPEAVLGTPQGKSIDGALGALIFNEDNGFTRVQMKDYEYLFAQIQPTGMQKFVIVLIGFLLALVVWAVFVAVDLRLPASWRKALASATDDKPDDKTGPDSDDEEGSDFETRWNSRAQDLYTKRRRTEGTFRP